MAADGQPRFLDAAADVAADDGGDNKDPTAVCPFFNSQQDLERALAVLSSCTWDACDDDTRTKLFEARIELTEMAGFTDIADAVRLASAQAARAPAAKEGPDELDSYEALVRDAGKINNGLLQLTLHIIRICITFSSCYYSRILMTRKHESA